MVQAPSRTIAALLALGTLVAATALGLAAPRRAPAAAPQPPAAPAAQLPGAAPALTLAEARALTDTLLQRVSAVRLLKPLRQVPVAVASRAELRQRLEEIVAQEHAEDRLRQDEKLLKFLGLMPAAQDLMQLYKDLLEEQVAGFYDLDKRSLVFADWVPAGLQSSVADHELAHALQDQHFSLRVRKKLGFETADAEAAWNALIEGDACAVMMQAALGPDAKANFAMFADSVVTTLDRPPAGVTPGGLTSERLMAAPGAVRSLLSFPYLFGLRFVAALYRAGGWQRVDDAYVHPPVSTKQIMHPDLFLAHKDDPVSLEMPSLGGLLGPTYRPVATGSLGEYDLHAYLGQYVDPQIAAVACEGWAGSAYALYAGAADEPQFLALVTVWDSEDDAVEFFGGVIGAIEARYPKQIGYGEASSQDQVMWKVEADGRHLNLLRVHVRQVLCLEQVPSSTVMRILQKVDLGLRETDPTPQMRAFRKDDLPGNRRPGPDSADSAYTMRMELPNGWDRVDASADSQVILSARRGEARLEARLDRQAHHSVGVDGYIHGLAENLQGRGGNVYVQIDIDFPRKDLKMYQHIFSQTEAGKGEMVYCLGAVELPRGYGYVLVSGPSGEHDPFVQADFFTILEGLSVVPADADGAAAADSIGAPAAPDHD